MPKTYVVSLYPGRPQEGEKPAKVMELEAFSQLDAVQTAKAVLLPNERHLRYIRADAKGRTP